MTGVYLIPASLLAFLVGAVGSAYAQASAPPVTVSLPGTASRACADAAKAEAMKLAFQSIVRQEGSLAASSLTCLMNEASAAVWIKQEKKTSGKACEVSFEVRYDRPAMRKAGRTCRRSDVRAPVGIVLRAETDGHADNELMTQAFGRIATELGRSNFRVEGMPQFQDDFLRLKGIDGPCNFTGDRESVERGTEACKRQFPSYQAARDALTPRLETAMKRIPELSDWRECGGLFMSGEVRIRRGERDVSGTITIDYYALADPISSIEAFAIPIDTRIERGVDAAVADALDQLTQQSVLDAIRKLSAFAVSHGCTLPPN